MLSARYATATLAVLAIALVPTILNSYVPPGEAEGPAVREVLPETLEGRTSVPTSRRAATIRREFDSDDWVEREYGRLGEPAVKLLVVRSYDMKRLYHHPELAVSEADYDAAQLTRVDTPEGPIDVHVLPGRAGGLAAYALVYRGRTVAHPLWFQLAVAPELLFTGRRPLTLVFAEQPGQQPTDDATQTAAVQTVAAAVRLLRR